MIFDLSLCQWKLKGYWPYTPLFGKSLETAEELLGVTEWIDATVPGGVQHDLMKAGVIEDYHYELNSLKCEWVEHRWWVYKTDFSLPAGFRGRRLTLVFKGLDYKAHIFLNREKLAEHEGMFDAVALDVTDRLLRDGENELTVLFENAPWEIAQIGFSSLVHTQKSRFGYKWDFCTRLVNIGIWDDVYIKAAGDISIGDIDVHTDAEGGAGIVHVACGLRGRPGDACIVKSALEFQGEAVASHEEAVVLSGEPQACGNVFRVPNARLWHPNGAGEQPLYTVRIEVLQNGSVSDVYEGRAGIRRLEYRRNPGSPEEALPYTFVVNGSPVYIKGVNLTPFDLMYGNVRREDYDSYLKLLKLCNVNLVRINGIGVIEKECFYDLCDRYGILVWQDFIQSGSGMDSIPSSDARYLALLEKAVLQAVREKRNHVSHAVWCGGNELSYRHVVPVGFEDPNIQKLRELVNENDPGKLFLPSTPSGPMFFNSAEHPDKNHDVHGNWKYEGIERHYALHNTSTSLFHSEFGVDGMSPLSSLERFMGKGNIRVTNTMENLVWRHHGEWWDTLRRDEGIFGRFDSLAQFIKASQFIQAEGVRYIVEANRRRQPNNSGSIVWQFNEPWPNVSCTSMVDYYKRPKMAYYWLAEAYRPVHISLRYDRLWCEPGGDFRARAYLHDDAGGRLNAVCEILDIHGGVLYRRDSAAAAGANGCTELFDIGLALPRCPSDLFFVRLGLADSEGNPTDGNLYVFSQLEKEIFSPLLRIAGANLLIREENAGCTLKNTGDAVCLFIHGAEETGEGCPYIGNNYSSLFPGEELFFSVGEPGPARKEDGNGHKVAWDYFNSALR